MDKLTNKKKRDCDNKFYIIHIKDDDKEYFKLGRT